MDASNYIYVAASAANFGTTFSDNTDHTLQSYYIQLSNPNAGKYHLGNSIDVYCHAPTDMLEKSATYTISNGEILVTDGYIQDILEVRETNSQIAYPTAEYSIFNNKPGETFGPDNEYKVAFSDEADGTSITVIYRA
jgi:hypothetical protein